MLTGSVALNILDNDTRRHYVTEINQAKVDGTSFERVNEQVFRGREAVVADC